MAINWKATRDALLAATVTGGDVAVRDELVAALNAIGQSYDTFISTQGDYDAELAQRSASFAAANSTLQRTIRYCLGLLGPPNVAMQASAILAHPKVGILPAEVVATLEAEDAFLRSLIASPLPSLPPPPPNDIVVAVQNGNDFLALLAFTG